MLKSKRIGVIGGGKMGSALIAGILSRDLVPAENVTVSDVAKERREDLKKAYGVNASDDNKKTVKCADIVILAVKPQNMAEILQEVAGVVDTKK
ncbi:MAG: NAD(P)-binding domain-containing protein, partial [Deltaproteobacteria bacterium]|nr:NAD(P)-binding domain-containing protein [Deltaproteobacteria bacterium]